MADRQLALPEAPGAGRLGRHVNHDPQSLRFLVQPEPRRIGSVKHERHVKPFDQNTAGPKRQGLGSCTANALLGVLATDPFWDTLPKDLQQTLADPERAQVLATQVYREETAADPFDGQYEPDDTGSDGLTSAKIAKTRGWCSGYKHATSLPAALTMLQDSSYTTGVMWTEGCDQPDREGIVRPRQGRPRGGHQFQVAEYDSARGLLGCWQSWGLTFGKSGKFWIPEDDYAWLLAQQGDATDLLPITAPAPQPAPAPAVELDGLPVVELDAWAAAARSWWAKRDRTAATAYKTWRSTHR